MGIVMKRRQVLLGGLLTVVFASGFGVCRQCAAFQAGPRAKGCIVDKSEAPEYFLRVENTTGGDPNSDLVPRSGDPEFDRALADTLGRLALGFRTLPGFAYYRDDDGPNALATPEILLRRSNGTVLFGLTLRQLMLENMENPHVAIDAVCAHEFGHIIQYNRELIGKLIPDPENMPPLRAELMADYMAGYFSAMRKAENPDYPAEVFVKTQYAFGDPPDVRSHGTPDERSGAVAEGFKAFHERQLDLDSAIDEGFKFGMSQQF